MRTYYIYKATNLINGKSYIGQTVHLKERIWQHLRRYEKEDCLFHQELEKYGDDSFEWEVVDTANSEREAIELEKKYIKEFGTLSPKGYNMNKGGVGGHNARSVVCLDFDGAFVKRYDSAANAQEEDGYCNSDVLLSCKNKISKCRNKMFMFEDEYLKYGPKTYKKPDAYNKKPIIQCDLKGNYICRHESVKSASKQTGIGRTRISSALNGYCKTAGGFIFVFEKDFLSIKFEDYKANKKGRKVVQIDPETDEIIEAYESIADAGRKLNVNYKVIHKVVDIEGRTAYGYKWKSQ